MDIKKKDSDLLRIMYPLDVWGFVLGCQKHGLLFTGRERFSKGHFLLNVYFSNYF